MNFTPKSTIFYFSEQYMPLIFCVNALLHNSNKLYFSVQQINQLALTLPCFPPHQYSPCIAREQKS